MLRWRRCAGGAAPESREYRNHCKPRAPFYRLPQGFATMKGAARLQNRANRALGNMRVPPTAVSPACRLARVSARTLMQPAWCTAEAAQAAVGVAQTPPRRGGLASCARFLASGQGHVVDAAGRVLGFVYERPHQCIYS